MPSTEREILEQIHSGHQMWIPVDESPLARQRFASYAERLVTLLDRLVTKGYVPCYTTRQDPENSERCIVCVTVEQGLTDKGRNQALWPT